MKETEKHFPITIREERPDSKDALMLLAELDENLLSFDYPPQSRHAFSVEKLLHDKVAFFVARYAGQPSGCGGVKIFPGDYGEVKRMFVRPDFRGLGIAKAILKHLEGYTAARGAPWLRLETGIYQTEAIGLYESYGFQRCSPFGEYREDPMSIYFEKPISGSTR
jgi:putative acetyltransferase